jgi:hypothetical protein
MVKFGGAAGVGTNINYGDEFFGDSILSVEHRIFEQKKIVNYC